MLFAVGRKCEARLDAEYAECISESNAQVLCVWCKVPLTLQQSLSSLFSSTQINECECACTFHDSIKYPNLEKGVAELCFMLGIVRGKFMLELAFFMLVTRSFCEIIDDFGNAITFLICTQFFSCLPSKF